MLVPRGAPNLVCTTFVANALLDLYEETGELLAWLARALDQQWRARMILTRHAVAAELPVDADVRGFLRELHATLVTTPTVARWRERAAMHWSVSAGSTWGSVQPLPESQVELWPEAQQLLS